MAVPHRRWIEERLKVLGLSRQDLAEKVGMQLRQVERWMAGAGAHLTTQFNIALALELPPDQVYALFLSKDASAGRQLAVVGEQDREGEYRPVSTEAFYQYYASRIAGGSREIWITSDGFNMRNVSSHAYAEVMGSGFDAALANGAVVYRYQMTETMHVNWIDELARLKAAYPRQFRVFVNPTVAQVANVCAVDPGTARCVAEQFEGKRGGFGQGTVAADYSFRLHDREAARARQDVVQAAIDHPDAKELSAEGLEKLRAALFSQRVQQLEAWGQNPENEDADIADSLVFDEAVISHFVRRACDPKRRRQAV